MENELREKKRKNHIWYWISLILTIIKIVIFYNVVQFQAWQYAVACMTILICVGMFECCVRRRRNVIPFVLFSISYGLVSLLMAIDAMYYGYFAQYASINQLFQLENLVQTTGAIELHGVISIGSLLLLIWDIPFVLYGAYRCRKEKNRVVSIGVGILIFVCAFFIWNPQGSSMITGITKLEFFSYHSKDIAVFVKEQIQTSSMSQEEVKRKIKELVPSASGTKYHGIGKGKNLIVIQMESFQKFPIGRTYEGQEITPNINALLNNDTLYFENYYQTLGKGNTADAEFATLNSFYPVTEQESYRRYVQNNYNGLPWLMRQQGYATLAFHGNVRSFWNRGQMYPQEGFEFFYSQEYLDATEISGFGITDKELFRQTVHILKQQTKPTFSFIVTVTNHIPYDLDDSLTSLKLKPEDETLFGHYLQAVHYADEAIGQFIMQLKEAGLYDNTVIALYGDHHGMLISDDEFYASIQEEVPKYIGRAYDYDEMLNIPLIIHVPNSGIKESIETVGGEVDFLPTIANIMGITIPQPYIFGKDIVNVTKEEDSFVASVTYLLEGSFIWGNTMYQIGRDGTFEHGRAWNTETGETVPLTEELEQQSKRASQLVQLSKKVLDDNAMSEYAGQSYLEPMN